MSLQKEDHVVVISVTDTGMGIPEKALPDLFEMFSEVSRNMGRSQGRLGIGLSLVRSLVQMHGGIVVRRVRVKEKAVPLPFVCPWSMKARAPTCFRKQGVGEDVSVSNILKILVAGDNIDATMMMMALLEINGHDVELAHAGLHALVKVKVNQYNLPILDIDMPGLNGYEVAAAIREIPRNGRCFVYIYKISYSHTIPH